MIKFNPIYLENSSFSVHPFRKMDMNRINEIENEIFELLSNNEILKFIPEKRLNNINEAKDRIYGIMLGYETELSFMHFITDNKTKKIIGIVDVISPKRVEKTYYLKKYDWMIEFVLHKDYWHNGLMTNVISAFCIEFKELGINKISAVCDIDNIGSIKVLTRNGFKKIYKFDLTKDYFENEL